MIKHICLCQGVNPPDLKVTNIFVSLAVCYDAPCPMSSGSRVRVDTLESFCKDSFYLKLI